jgi:site-specific DNA recombinase
MHPHDTPNGASSISAEERAALLAILPTAGKERPAIHAHAAAVYARLSMRKNDEKNGHKNDDDEADDPDSIKAQLQAGRRYAARIGVPVLRELEDVKSGLLADRDDYQRLIQLAEGDKISHVILFKADRLSRDDAEFTRVARRLMQLGIEIHDTLTGRLTPEMVGFHAFQANYEVRNISARTTMGMTFKAQAGRRVGRPPLGYCRTLTKGVYEKDPVAGDVITELFARYAAGEGLRPLTRWLNATLGLNKCPSAVSRLLKNPFYKGITVWGKERKSKIDGRYARPRDEWVFARHDAPLVDDATWDTVQARLALAANVGQHRARPARYLLSGLIRCAACGYRMCGHQFRDGYHLYVCDPCRATRSQRRVHQAVRTLLEGVPIGAQRITAALEANERRDHEEAGAELAALDARLTALTQRRVRLTALYADGQIDGQDYAATLAETDKERAKLRTEREALEQILHRTSLAQADTCHRAPGRSGDGDDDARRTPAQRPQAAAQNPARDYRSHSGSGSGSPRLECSTHPGGDLGARRERGQTDGPKVRARDQPRRSARQSQPW